MRPRLRAGLLRRALRGATPTRGASRPAPYERGEVRRDDRRAGRPPLRDRRSRSAARSACSPRGSPSAATRCSPSTSRRPPLDAARASALADGADVVERRELPEELPRGAVRPDRLLGGPLLPRRRRASTRCSTAIGRALEPGGLLAVHWRPPTRDLPARAATRSTSGSRARFGPRRHTRDRTPEYALDRFDVDVSGLADRRRRPRRRSPPPAPTATPAGTAP